MTVHIPKLNLIFSPQSLKLATQRTTQRKSRSENGLKPLRRLQWTTIPNSNITGTLWSEYRQDFAILDCARNEDMQTARKVLKSARTVRRRMDDSVSSLAIPPLQLDENELVAEFFRPIQRQRYPPCAVAESQRRMDEEKSWDTGSVLVPSRLKAVSICLKGLGVFSQGSALVVNSVVHHFSQIWKADFGLLFSQESIHAPKARGKERILTRDDLSLILDVLPTEEESEAMHLRLEKGLPIHATDALLGDLTKLKDCFPVIWTLLHRISTELTFHKICLATVKLKRCLAATSMALRPRGPLRRILEYVMLSGNFINDGSYAGGSSGFRMESLLLLKDYRVKQEKGSRSLLDLLGESILQAAQKKESAALDYLWALRRILDSGTPIDFAALQVDLNSLTDTLETIRLHVADFQDGTLSSDANYHTPRLIRKSLKTSSAVALQEGVGLRSPHLHHIHENWIDCSVQIMQHALKYLAWIDVYVDVTRKHFALLSNDYEDLRRYLGESDGPPSTNVLEIFRIFLTNLLSAIKGKENLAKETQKIRSRRRSSLTSLRTRRSATRGVDCAKCYSPHCLPEDLELVSDTETIERLVGILSDKGNSDLIVPSSSIHTPQNSSGRFPSPHIALAIDTDDVSLVKIDARENFTTPATKRFVMSQASIPSRRDPTDIGTPVPLDWKNGSEWPNLSEISTASGTQPQVSAGDDGENIPPISTNKRERGVLGMAEDSSDTTEENATSSRNSQLAQSCSGSDSEGQITFCRLGYQMRKVAREDCVDCRSCQFESLLKQIVASEQLTCQTSPEESRCEDDWFVGIVLRVRRSLGAALSGLKRLWPFNRIAELSTCLDVPRFCSSLIQVSLPEEILWDKPSEERFKKQHCQNLRCRVLRGTLSLDSRETTPNSAKIKVSTPSLFTRLHVFETPTTSWQLRHEPKCVASAFGAAVAEENFRNYLSGSEVSCKKQRSKNQVPQI